MWTMLILNVRDLRIIPVEIASVLKGYSNGEMAIKGPGCCWRSRYICVIYCACMLYSVIVCMRVRCMCSVLYER